MRVTVDGFPEDLPAGLTIADLVDMREADDTTLITEVNHRFIHKKDYSHTVLTDGDQVEFIYAAFGG
ncbi:MAG: sulfur carrier protein ThiS [Deltaproteobacteria bacterium]|nr:sulfur carrier protein ThiS [Deltaproteobacteria bacterium]